MRYAPLVITLIIAGCASTGEPRTRYSEEVEVRGFDFTEYTEEGFLITPQRYEGEYQAVGLLELTLWPEMHRSIAEPYAGNPPGQRPWVTDSVDPRRAVDSLYARAKQMGADAIIQFNTSTVTESIQDGTRDGVRVRGFAIDRAGN